MSTRGQQQVVAITGNLFTGNRNTNVGIFGPTAHLFYPVGNLLHQPVERFAPLDILIPRSFGLTLNPLLKLLFEVDPDISGDNIAALFGLGEAL